ncbi:pyridoxal phosphate-dependent aminotransferase family protein [Duganella sp. FT3S]|uniref:Pyridoxal phosphate-dependent aminotransferase family protein n=1 Tax=Rugamonas fusca TaxID=2758568 RepID=A0A7W2I516_9BURK|nr:pyridoxal phosphate-dependent aminotransferase family protein [Rugamonas fusca]MBA5603887.1 pyridoxal phosphate-dependent aminotransferase family protein [Rugamonas fusca]
MADFCSALYLGLRHPSAALADWPALTLGRPAALEEAPGAGQVAADLARLQGSEAALLMPSTLHLFWDLFGVLADQPLALLVDGGAYPIARWGAQRAVLRGATMQIFPHGAAQVADRLAWRAALAGRRPLILADGYCPGMDTGPPLAAYARIAADKHGYLVLDDTQVLGVKGGQGGGSLRLPGVVGPHVMVGASLAKGFGAPLAVLAGSAAMMKRCADRSEVLRHCSPPSVAAIAAAGRALVINRTCGDRLRARLWRNVARFRAGAALRGMFCRGGAFPVQTVPLPCGAAPARMQAALASRGIHAVAQWTGRCGALTFLLRADHRPEQIERALDALAILLEKAYEPEI